MFVVKANSHCGANCFDCFGSPVPRCRLEDAFVVAQEWHLQSRAFSYSSPPQEARSGSIELLSASPKRRDMRSELSCELTSPRPGSTTEHTHQPPHPSPQNNVHAEAALQSPVHISTISIPSPLRLRPSPAAVRRRSTVTPRRPPHRRDIDANIDLEIIES